MDWKVQQRFGFVKIEGSLKYAIPAVDRGRGHRYLTEIDPFSLPPHTPPPKKKGNRICTYALDIL